MVWLESTSQPMSSLSLIGSMSSNFLKSVLVPVYAIANDTSCTQSGSSQPSLSCSLNHAGNVLILIYATIDNTSNNGGTVSSVTDSPQTGGSFSATLITSQGSSTSLRFYVYWIFIPASSSDNITVRFAGASNNAEAMAAVSQTGTRLSLPFVNSQKGNALSFGTSVTLTVPAGEGNRRVIEGIGINSNASITQGGSQTGIAQVNASGASIEINYQNSGNPVGMSGSWSGSTGNAAIALAILPPSQIVTDSNTSGGNAAGTGSITDGSSGTIGALNVNVPSLCIVGVGISDGSGQTVTSVKGASMSDAGLFIHLVDSGNGSNVLASLWYLYDWSSATTTGTITVTLSAAANAVMVAACFANAKALQLWEGQTTNAGDSGTATTGSVAGANTVARRVFGLFVFATNSNPTGSQGVDLEVTNANGTGIDLNYLDSSSTANMQAADSSSNWAAIGVALLPFPIQRDSTSGSSCSANTSASAATSCTISYAVGTLITVWSGNAGSDTESSVTVNGNTASLEAVMTQGSSERLTLYYYYSAASASGVSVTVNWTNHNSPESLIAVAWVGTRSSPPFFNNQITYSGTGASSINGILGGVGNFNSLFLSGVETGANNSFVPGQLPYHTNYSVVQVSGDGNSLDLTAQISRTVGAIGSSWGTSTGYAQIIIAILPPNILVIDSQTTTYSGICINSSGVEIFSATCSSGGQSVFALTRQGHGSFVTSELPPHDPDVLAIADIHMVNTTDANVVSVTTNEQTFTPLATSVNGNMTVSLWYLWDVDSASENITTTFSTSVDYGVWATLLVGTASAGGCIPSSNCFEDTTTNTGSSNAPSVALASGTANRLGWMASAWPQMPAGQSPTCNAGVLYQSSVGNVGMVGEGTGRASCGYSFGTGQAYTLGISILPSSVSSNWAAVGTGILPAFLQAFTTIVTQNTTAYSSATSTMSTVVGSTTTTSSQPTLITNTVSTTTTMTGPFLGSTTTTFTSLLSTSYSTTSTVTSGAMSVTQTGMTTGTIQSETTTSTGTLFSTTTSSGTVMVTESETFNVLLTQLVQELDQFEMLILQTLGFQVTATPVGQQVNWVILTTTSTTTPAQVTMTVSYSVVGGGSPSAPVFHYVLGGVSKSLTLTQTPTAVTVDSRSPWSVTPNPLTGSGSSQQWIATVRISGIASATTIVFSFEHQYYLTTKVSGAGIVSPNSGWYNAGQTVTIKATPSSGHKFKSWKGSGLGSYSGIKNPTTVMMNAAITETASFT